jgi:hypothetical protein
VTGATKASSTLRKEPSNRIDDISGASLARARHYRDRSLELRNLDAAADRL